MTKVVWTGVVLSLSVLAGVASAQDEASQGRGRARTRMQHRVQARMERMDQNRDGRISRDEWPRAARRFDRLDANHDGTLTQDELLRGATAHRRHARRTVK